MSAAGPPQRPPPQPYPRLVPQQGPQGRRAFRRPFPGGGRGGPNSRRKLLLGLGLVGGGAFALNWLFGEDEFNLEEDAWNAIQRGALGDFYEGTDEQGRRFVVDSEGNVGYETLDANGKVSDDLLDGYVVTPEGTMFYEKYDDKEQAINRTEIGTCKRTMKNSSLPLYDLDCTVGGNAFRSTMTDLRKVNGPTFER